MRRRVALVGCVAALVAVMVRLPVGAAPPPPNVLIFVAASLQTALDELTPQMERTSGAVIRISYAASSALARQIESGAPAEMFISADEDWMNYVADRHLIKPETRANLLGNALVLIAPARQPVRLKIAPGFALAAHLGTGRLAIAEPTAVPAGKYAQAALTNLGVWSSVASKLAPSENVRAALLLVSRGEAPLGIVYRTDALADRAVMIVDTFPEATHPPIVYPAALTVTASADAMRVLTFLRSPPARAVFARQGFQVNVK
jgi:molybdate transport system substrate-binding protein